MSSSVKQFFYNTVTTYPNWLNVSLLYLNRFPKQIYGPNYSKYNDYLTLNRNQFDNRHQLLTFVNRALQEVPYYRDRYGIFEIRSVEDFENTIDPIDKDTVLQHFSSFLDPQIDTSKYDHGTTGGTSGKPMQLIAPRDRYVTELATMHSLWASAGFNFHVRGVIRNHRLGAKEAYRVNPITREFYFDGFRLTDSYFETVYRVCKKENIQFLHCYPSAAYEFGLFLQRKRLDPSIFKAFLSGSENVFQYQVELLENELGIRFYNWYGHSEKLVLGGYCQFNRLYHIEPTYGYFELLDEAGRPIQEPGGWGEIVGTSFHNPGMPLIRYRTGDYAELFGYECPDCGRRLPLLKKIHGRWSGERIYRADGSFVSITALNLHSEIYKHINGIQYQQENKGQLKVLVVKADSYLPDHKQQLLRHFQERLNGGTEIEIEYVSRLKRKPNGKFVQLLSKIDQNHASWGQ